MKRVFATATLSAVVLLLTAAPAFAGLALHTRSGARLAPTPHVPLKAAPLLRTFAPLGARLAGATANVSGTIRNSAGSALSGVSMEWWSQIDTSDWTNGSMTSQAGGTYSVSPAATTNGEIWAYPDDNTTWALTGQTWTAGGSYPGTDISPGVVSVSVARDGVWPSFGGITLDLWGGTVYSHAWLPTTDTSTSPAVIQPDVMNGTYDVGSVNFWLDEGVEIAPSPTLTVASGSTPSGMISVSENGAKRVAIPGFKYSGKPGATITVDRYNYPSGWINYVSGYSDPSGTSARTYGDKLSSGSTKQSLSVTIPPTAKAGYSYWIGFQHRLASGKFQPLYVETSYQVCTMKASKTSISKGTRIRVTGVVPTQDHWKSQLGVRKQVVAIWHKGVVTPATKRGWHLMASTRCTGTGAYTSPYFKVPATGTLMVVYDEDQWYRSGCTTPVKITVR